MQRDSDCDLPSSLSSWSSIAITIGIVIIFIVVVISKVVVLATVSKMRIFIKVMPL